MAEVLVEANSFMLTNPSEVSVKAHESVKSRVRFCSFQRILGRLNTFEQNDQNIDLFELEYRILPYKRPAQINASAQISAWSEA